MQRRIGAAELGHADGANGPGNAAKPRSQMPTLATAIGRAEREAQHLLINVRVAR